MNTPAVAVFGALVALLAAARGDRTVAIGDPNRPNFVGCQTSEECGKNACCVIGMSRYSSPRCLARRDVGEGCRPGGEPVATTLHYPNGVSVEIGDSYFVHCPCQRGLRCDGAGDEPVCADGRPQNGLLGEREEDRDRDDLEARGGRW